MSTGNQGQGQGRRNEGQGRNNGGRGPNPAREGGQSQGSGQNVRQGMEEVSNRVQEGYESAREEVSRRVRQAEGAVARNPAPSVLMGFGLGFGIGLALTVALTQREESWAERYLPDSLRNLPDSWRNARVPEMPSSMHSSFQHLADSIRDLPSAIARAMPSR
jgi:hypothetical protein